VAAAWGPLACPASCQKQQRRHLAIHEYLSMGLLRDNGVKVPRFMVASTPDEVLKHANEIGQCKLVHRDSVVHWLSICLQCRRFGIFQGEIIISLVSLRILWPSPWSCPDSITCWASPDSDQVPPGGSECCSSGRDGIKDVGSDYTYSK
jgi:succinyl-CoA synthetase beta subunit